LIQAGGNTLHSENHKLWIRKNCHSSERNLLLYIFIKRGIKLTVAIIEEYHFCQLHIKFYPIFLSQGQLHNVLDQQLIRYSATIRYWRKMGV
jgi:hypothetical protein